MDDFEKSIIQRSKIHAVHFHILSQDEIEKLGNVIINNNEIMKLDKPAMGGLYDPHMGTTDSSYNCQTCQNNKINCPGHFGTLELNYPVKHPCFYDELLRWLKVICHNCGNPVLDIKVASSGDKLKIAATAANTKKVVKCPHCEHPYQQIIRDKLKPVVFKKVIVKKSTGDQKSKNGKTTDKKIEQKTEPLLNHEIKIILDRISDETIRLFGILPECSPKNLILNVIPVPPNTLRPDSRKISGIKSSGSDTTNILKNIFDINKYIPSPLPPKEQITIGLNATIENLDAAYYAMVKGGGGGDNKFTIGNKPTVSLLERLGRKQGLVRRNLMGKRVEYMMRSVITGDSRLEIDQVGIPLIHAQNLEIPEKVTAFNYEYLLKFYNNATDVYPGCKRIQKAGSENVYLRRLLVDYKLQIGDTVFRDMITGDYICFNRQPSLLFTNIAGMRVVVMATGNTLRINPAVAQPFFNADFDGDQMNSIVPQCLYARNESMIISRVSRWFVSPQNHAPLIGAFQDGLIGISEMSKAGIKFDKWHAMQLFSDFSDSKVKYIFDKSTYTNREVISMLLPKINLVGRTPSFYKDQYQLFLKYNPEDIKVNIIRGELQSGVLDKSTTGQGQPGSIFHIIANEEGNERAIKVAYNLQQLTTKFFFYHGFTVGTNDIVINEAAMIDVKRKIEEIILKSRNITEKLYKGKLIPPLGISITDYYESEQINALETGDDFVHSILQATDINTNQMLKLILSGAKGKIRNFFNLNGSIGNQTINGKRFPMQCGWGRVLPYYLRYNPEPKANGFISMSYCEGVTSEVYPYMAAETRHGLISNALSTSITGHQNRIAIKNLEEVYVNNLLCTMKGNNVIQPLCYETGIDPSKLEQVTFPTIKLSNTDLENEYKTKLNQLPKKFQTNEIEELLSDEYNQIIADRNEYRKIHLKLERANPKEYIMTTEKQMPLNLVRIIEDTVYNYSNITEETKDIENRELDPGYVIETVKELCESLGYVFYNDIYRKNKRPISKVIKNSLTFTKILIRSYLSTSYLIKKKATNAHLKIIIAKIVHTYQKAVMDYGSMIGTIAVQCICEKFTQYILDSKHRTGGQGGTKTNAIVRIQEILSNKKLEKMKNPHMTIMVKPEYELNKAKVQEIANHIEMMEFGRFVSTIQIFFEEYGMPKHPKFKHEANAIKLYERHNYGISVPSDLAKWCIRFGINKEEMILKSIKLETIVLSLKKDHDDLFIINSQENVDDIFIRVYLRNTRFKQSNNYLNDNVKVVMEDLQKVIVRGIKDIVSTDVVEVICNKIDDNGALVRQKVFAIISNGSNLSEILNNPLIDPYRTQSDSLEEVQRVFGLIASRQKIVSEMLAAMTNLNNIQCGLFADVMCFPGYVSNINKTGLEKRDYSSVFLRLSFQMAGQVIKNAAMNGLTDRLSGEVSGKLIVGSNPEIGTAFNKIIINHKKIRETALNAAKVLEDL